MKQYLKSIIDTQITFKATAAISLIKKQLQTKTSDFTFL